MTENEQLRQRLGDGSAAPAHGEQATPDADLHQQSESTKMDHPQSVVSGIFISANGDSSYHGLTSTLFDGAPVSRHGSAQLANRPGPVEPIQQQLMGEAAYQSESRSMMDVLAHYRNWLRTLILSCQRAARNVELPTRKVGL